MENATDERNVTQRLREVFVREATNPIITPESIPLDAKAVCNPGATEFEDDVLLLLRVIGHDDHSSLLVARSRNGVSDWRYGAEPLLKGEEWYDEWGCEDARITYVEERGEYVIAYAGLLAVRRGRLPRDHAGLPDGDPAGHVLHPYNKDAALFPRRSGASTASSTVRRWLRWRTSGSLRATTSFTGQAVQRAPGR